MWDDNREPYTNREQCGHCFDQLPQMTLQSDNNILQIVTSFILCLQFTDGQWPSVSVLFFMPPVWCCPVCKNDDGGIMHT